MPTWLTVADIAARLGRAESTIRLWRDRYRRFVPEQRDDEGRQTYPIERIEEIAALQAQRLTPREVAAELSRRQGSGPVDAPGASAGPATLDQILAELRQIREDVRWLVERERARDPEA